MLAGMSRNALVLLQAGALHGAGGWPQLPQESASYWSCLVVVVWHIAVQCASLW